MAESIDIPTNIIANLLDGACPERAEEFAVFWDQFEPRFALKQDSRGLSISAYKNKISWMHKTFVHDWIVAFAGFKALAAYSPHVLLGNTITCEISEHSLNDDTDLEEAEDELDTLLYFAKQVPLVSDLEELDWLTEVPKPGTNRETMVSNIDKACFDIACIAAAATFLHELRHIQFESEGDAPIVKADEERACDDFSRKMLLEKVNAYCAVSGEEIDLVVSKRVIGLASAAMSIAQAESQNVANAILDTHPPIRERFIHLVLKADIDENAKCWTYTACLIIALLRRSTKLPKKVKFTSPKNLCDQLIVLL